MLLQLCITFIIIAVFYGTERRMVSSGMLHRVALVTADVSEELSASFVRVTRIGELGLTLAVTSTQCTLRASVAIYG
jgi:hypothetical protein